MPDPVSKPSPNFEPRRGADKPSLVVFHYTGMKDGPSALERLCDPLSKVSAHYLVEEDGRVYKLVDEKMRAWHAGVAFWRGIDDVNSHSIGIEIVNPGHEFGYRPFPQRQMEAVRDLGVDIACRYKLGPRAFLGHSDIAPLRKQDPGELFDWKFLAQAGIGYWPEKTPEVKDMSVKEAEDLLCRIGYSPPKSPGELKTTLIAFQRRYDPDNLSGQLDGATPGRLRALTLS
jgi:N-acetylmuramoyl-L-alanine amidase